MGVAQLCAKAAVDRPEDRQHGGDDREQKAVVAEHDHCRHEHLAQCNHGDEQNVLHEYADGLGVGSHAADDAAKPRIAEEIHLHRLQMTENVVAKVMEHPFAQLQGQTLAEMKREMREGGQPEKPETAPEQASAGMMGNGTVDHAA